MPKSVIITKTPTVQATPDYAAGDVLGGLMTLENVVEFIGDTGVLEYAAAHVAIDASSVPVGILLFSANPSSSTITENDAFALHANDRDKLIGAIDLDQVVDLGTPVVLHSSNLGIPFKPRLGTDLYAVAVAGGALNLGSTSDITFVFGIRRD